MAFTTSRLVSRKAPMKGIRAVGFAPFLASTPIVNTAIGVVTLPAIIKTPPSIARIEVKASSNNSVDTGTFDEATRTNEYVNVLTFFVAGNDLSLRNQVQGSAGILQSIFLEDYNGKIYSVGNTNGCDIMTLVGGTDQQGFTFTVNSKEVDMMYELAPAGITEYRAALLVNG
jgi:hypothetical protein